MDAKVKIKFDIKDIRKQLDRKYYPEFNWKFMRQVQVNIRQYVPFLTGQLMHTSYTPKPEQPDFHGKIIYPVPYASYIWNGKTFKFTTQTHPLATYEWVGKITRAEYQQIAQLVVKQVSLKVIQR